MRSLDVLSLLTLLFLVGPDSIDRAVSAEYTGFRIEIGQLPSTP